jgi:hypothetical protein
VGVIEASGMDPVSLAVVEALGRMRHSGPSRALSKGITHLRGWLNGTDVVVKLSFDRQPFVEPGFRTTEYVEAGSGVRTGESEQTLAVTQFVDGTTVRTRVKMRESLLGPWHS